MPLHASMTGALSAFFAVRNFTDVITSLPKPVTPMTDLLFPKNKRKQLTSPYIAVADVQEETGAVPVVVRGTQSFSVDGDKRSLGLVEVMPLSMNRVLLASELNNLVAMGMSEGVNAKLTEICENLRDRTSTSTEILVCQALSGNIAYPAHTEGGGSDTYQVELGKLKSLSASSLSSDSDIGALQKALEAQYIEQQLTGASSDVRFLAGVDAYALVVALATKNAGAVPIQWTDYGCILFGKYKIQAVSGTYKTPGSSEITEVIEAKSMQTVDLANAGKLFYAALDEFDARVQPLPFFATYEYQSDPSRVKVISSSKPLPAFAVSKSTVKKYLA